MARYGLVGFGTVWQVRWGWVRLILARSGMAGKVGYDAARCVEARYGRFGTVLLGVVRRGPVRQARHGSAGSG